VFEFRLNLMPSSTWGDDCLSEYFTIAIEYLPDGGYTLSISRSGIRKHRVPHIGFKLWNLGDYLSRLPAPEGFNVSIQTNPMAVILTYVHS